MNDEKFFIVDVSSNDDRVNWDTLADHHVVGAVVKATQGIHHRDKKFVEHLTQADRVRLVVGAYHWCDPTCDAEAQAQRFLDVIADQPISFIAAGMEQYWEDWDEWRQYRHRSGKHPQRMISPEAISENGQAIASYLAKQSNLPLLVYTKASFIQTYARPTLAWLPSFDLWLADYPYDDGEVETDWDDFLAHHLPEKPGPASPEGCRPWKMWQFTSDKFRLPGLHRSKINLSYFNGSKKQFYEFARHELFLWQS